MSDTERDLKRRIAERNFFMAPFIEAHERLMRELWYVVFMGLARMHIPKVPDYKVFRI